MKNIGKVKSIRLNEKTERMFTILKSYYKEINPKITDTEIISKGIIAQYEQVSDKLNSSFATKMEAELKEQTEALELFNIIYEALEVPCILNGDIIQDGFWGFLVVNCENGDFYEVNSETGERNLSNRWLEKIYESLLKDVSNEEKLDNILDCVNSAFFKLYGKDYGREN